MADNPLHYVITYALWILIPIYIMACTWQIKKLKWHNYNAKMMVLGTAIFVFGTIFNLLYTWYYGWNLVAINAIEELLDQATLGLWSVGTIMYLRHRNLYSKEETSDVSNV